MQRGQDFVGDIGDGLLHAFAAETFFVAVAQFEGFVFAGAGAGGNRRATDRAAASVTSTSTVGLPRESRISRA